MVNLVCEFYKTELIGLYDANGNGIADQQIKDNILDSTGMGDRQTACEFINEFYNIDFQIIKRCGDGKVRNLIATRKDKQTVCKELFFQGEPIDFSNEATSEMYLLWAALNNFEIQDN
jgi:hypothetical protein|tara:strand:- start:1 stop:354 length:354 start_codon:yes stop_codon:yes gene_type:complete